MSVIEPDRLTVFATNILAAAGADQEQAAEVAEALVWGDMFGRPNQGVWRLPILCKRLEAGLFSCPCRIAIDDRAPALAVVDGQNGIGHYVAKMAACFAVERAEKSGTAAVFVSDSNFFGAAGYYVHLMAERSMLGLAFSNSFPKVAPHGGTKPILGTNPLAFGAPRRRGRSVIIDMATAASAGSDITKAAELGQPLPVGIAIDRNGQPITDASKVKDGALMPLGGAKGYALGLLVEILCGVASGAGIAHSVRSMYQDFDSPGNSGHLFVAINIGALMPMENYYARMDVLSDALQECEGVTLPGEARWRAHDESKAAGGATLDGPTSTELTKLADRYGVETPWEHTLMTQAEGTPK